MEQTEPEAAGSAAGEHVGDRTTEPSGGLPSRPSLAPATAIAMGTEVRGADGARLGQVAAAWPAYVLVEQAPGSPVDYWVPVDAIAGYDGEVLVLTVERAEADRRGWAERPPGGPDQPH